MKNQKIFFLILATLLYVIGPLQAAEKTRPILDTIGYFWDPDQLMRLIRYLEKHDSSKASGKDMIAAISPHDDYLYAAGVYYPLFSRIKPKEVVIFGVTHRGPRRAIGNREDVLILDSYTNWTGPYGKIPVSELREKMKRELTKGDFMIDDHAHGLEHSIEGMLPFLQHYSRNVKITPVMVTPMKAEKLDRVSRKMGQIILDYARQKGFRIGKDLFILISSDGNHYGPDFKNTHFGSGEKAHREGIAYDREVVDKTLTGPLNMTKLESFDRMLDGKTYWCGRYSIIFGVATLLQVHRGHHQMNPLSGKLLAFSDSYSSGVIPLQKTGYGITAPFSLDHWVSHISIGFYKR